MDKKKRVHFLRHVTLKECESMDLEKIKAIVDWLRPKTIIEIKTFLRFTGITGGV